MKPRTKAGRRLMRWIDANATDDRMIYAVVKNGPTVGDLRAAIQAIEEEAAAGLALELDRLVSIVHDAIYAEPFDQKAASDAVWSVHEVARSSLKEGSSVMKHGSAA